MEKWFRVALFITGIINLFGGMTFIPANRLGREMFKFPEAPAPYLWFIAVWILAFGVLYLWLAFRERSEWMFIVIAAVGKLSFFGAFFFCWLAGEIQFITVVGSAGDLIFGGIFAFWAIKHWKD